MYVCVCAGVVCIWSQKYNVRSLPSLLMTLSLRHIVSHWTQHSYQLAMLISQQGPGIYLSIYPRITDVCGHVWLLHRAPRSDLGPCACLAGTSPPEPLPQTLLHLYTTCNSKWNPNECVTGTSWTEANGFLATLKCNMLTVWTSGTLKNRVGLPCL
jgi:hypothetical protein